MIGGANQHRGNEQAGAFIDGGAMMVDRPLRVGLLGYGLAGRVFHGPLIAASPGLHLAAIVTSDPDRQARAHADHPSARVVGRSELLFEGAAELDLVVVATPNRFHVPLAVAAIESRLPVVVDKPMSPTAAEGRRLVETAVHAGVPFTVFQSRRWDGDFLTLEKLLAEGAFGAVRRFESRFERWQPEIEAGWRELPDPEEAGGQLLDLGAHLVDQALQLFGPATHVYAEIDTRRPGAKVDDDSFVALTHASGTRSHLFMSATAAQLGPRYRVLGDRAGFTKFGLDPQEDALAAGGTPGAAGWGEEEPDRWGLFGPEGDTRAIRTEPGRYLDFYSGVEAAVRDGRPMPVDPRDSVVALEVMEAAVASSATRSVVAIGRQGSQPA
jgi:predicted dehydrogenase